MSLAFISFEWNTNLAYSILPYSMNNFPLAFFWNSRSSQNIEENWRAGRTSICESDDGRVTPLTHSTSASNSGPSSIHRQSPTTYANSQPPGVLVLPDHVQLSSNAAPSRQQQPTQQPKRILFDPKNPHKPTAMSSPGGRIGPHHRWGFTTSKSYNIADSLYQSWKFMEFLWLSFIEITMCPSKILALLYTSLILECHQSYTMVSKVHL